jgi:hypothetical protein
MAQDRAQVRVAQDVAQVRVAQDLARNTLAAKKRCTSKSWEAHFAQLCKFVDEHGHARVPWRHTEHAGLGRFVTRAREAYQADLDRRAGRVPKSACRITTDQIRRLESVGFEWRPRKQRIPRTWTVHLAALASYATVHGHARVPYVYPEDPALGRWVHTQRAAYRGEKLRRAGTGTWCDKRISADRIAKLEAVGFEWDPPKTPVVGPGVWEKQFALLQEFAAVHGHCRVPRSAQHDPSLSRWVHKQRSAYRAEQDRAQHRPPQSPNRITADKIARLNVLGFQWA